MTINKNSWYTVKSGDTLSGIAREAGIEDWKTIYNDPNNAEFRKKRPNPDKIYPGDEIWIPDSSSGVRTSTGKKTVFVVTDEQIQVTEIFFDSEINIHYVRLSANHPDYIAPDVPVIPGYIHLNPPKIYPEMNKPHWVFDTKLSKVSQSWPIVLIRDGSLSSTNAKRNLWVTFLSSVPFDGDRIIKAESPGGEILVGEQVVSFTQGKAIKVPFTFTKIPDKVEKLSGIILKWYMKKNKSGQYYEISETKVTIYIVDEKPCKANLRGLDMFLFEIIDWSCTWAKGKSGIGEIISSIWKEFYPVKSNHATGFVYWKNWRLKVEPQQTIDLAIRSQDDVDPKARNAVSCVVFDNIFINCLLIQGIKAAEIRVVPSKASSSGFIKDKQKYYCVAFNASSVKAQGNDNSPQAWQSHWIASVLDIDSKWKIYDPSYGNASYPSNEPLVRYEVDIFAYEKIGVKDFIYYSYNNNSIINLKAGKTQSEPPHISGFVLWRP